jgi:hypothetical protein
MVNKPYLVNNNLLVTPEENETKVTVSPKFFQTAKSSFMGNFDA